MKQFFDYIKRKWKFLLTVLVVLVLYAWTCWTFIPFDITLRAPLADWIQASLAVLEIPVVLYGLLKLFAKNEELQVQIDALKDIAKHQQVLTQTVQDSNILLRQQLEVEAKAFKDDEQHKKVLVKQRRMDKRPFFKWNSGSRSADHAEFELKNYGKTAERIELQDVESDIVEVRIMPPIPPSVMELGIIKIDLRSKIASQGTREGTYKLKLVFKDEEGNEYYQAIEGKGTQARVGKPTEMT